MSLPLPPLESFSGNWQEYVDRIYRIYQKLILYSGLRFRGEPVKPRYTPKTNGKEYGFWHVVQEGPVEEERTPDLRRCEHIRWISWIIENVNNFKEITWWEENPKSSITDVVLWLEAKQYVVILSKRRNYWLLKTAYPVDKPHKRRSLERNRKKYWKAQNG